MNTSQFISLHPVLLRHFTEVNNTMFLYVCKCMLTTFRQRFVICASAHIPAFARLVSFLFCLRLSVVCTHTLVRAFRLNLTSSSVSLFIKFCFFRFPNFCKFNPITNIIHISIYYVIAR